MTNGARDRPRRLTVRQGEPAWQTDPAWRSGSAWQGDPRCPGRPTCTAVARRSSRRTVAPRLLVIALVALVGGCGADTDGPPVEVTIPPGASFPSVVDSLTHRGVVARPTLFSMYARVTGADREIRAGRYRFLAGAPWSELLDDLTAGRVLTQALTIPEGWTVRQMAEPLAELTGVPPDSLGTLLLSDSLARRYDVPGPGLEGYLFPETYRFAAGVPVDRVLSVLTRGWHEFWTEARLARLDSLGMTRAQVTTLASIIQAEAGNLEEMPTISGVYHNRLQRGWLLQADPTVLYALGGPRDRLLFAAIDSVADNPYNTYRNPGLPPGPIGSPGERALAAALTPEDVDYMFFVAGPDGGHVFSVTHAEHNRAVADYRRRRAEARASTRGENTPR